MNLQHLVLKSSYLREILLTLNDQRSETPRKARVLDKIKRGTELYLRLTLWNILLLILPNLGTHVLN